MKWDYELALKKITNKVKKEFENKLALIKEKRPDLDFNKIECNELLMAVDRNWIDHIDAMDQLRKGISLRAYGQVDPVISYKKEGFDMFDEMIGRIQRITITRLLKISMLIQTEPQPIVNVNVSGAQQGAPGAPVVIRIPARTEELRPYRRQRPMSPIEMQKAQELAAQQQKENADKEENK
jgi:preprotein translocase subunit SecA